MTELAARTLAEAYVFIELTLGRRTPVDMYALTELRYVDGNSVLRVNGWHDGEQHDFTIVVPGVEIRAHFRPGELYGEGRTPSWLIDAGQWHGVENYAAANLATIVEQAAGGSFTPDDVNDFAKSLESALSALTEIGKFIPEGADEVPPEAFWSDTGRAIRDRDPGAFQRWRLVRDEAQYLSMADQVNAFRAAQGS